MYALMTAHNRALSNNAHDHTACMHEIDSIVCITYTYSILLLTIEHS